ncbi:Adaptive-response sensory-kinase SasA [Emticicia aquatica]|uniref:histidine kinase n=2 Tax=Emticicia aquatica TaxID=1681835 RepID=A0ABM9ATM7_9BACT|nr:Adaptive-response sensory-kinase SasA [Emticicia aquatica]
MFGGAAMNFFIFEKDAPAASEQHYFSSIQSRVKAEILVSKGELVNIANQYQKSSGNAFLNFETPTIYPYYIFRKGQLFYWSDHRFVPDYHQLVKGEKASLLSTENGKYITNSVSLNYQGNQVEIFSLINLYRKFRNENDYLKNGYNYKIFATEPKEITHNLSEKKYQNIPDEKGDFLFAIIPPQIEKINSPNIPTNTLLLLGVSVFLFGLYIVIWVNRLRKKHQFGRAFILLVFYLFFVRLVMLANSIPFIFYESNLFNPKFFTINELAPSLGDVLLNAVVVFFLAIYLVRFFYRSTLYYKLFKAPRIIQGLVSIILVAAAIVTAAICYRNLCNIYEKSQFSLDLALSISFTSLKIATLLFYLLLSVIFFLIIHLQSSLFLRINKYQKEGIINWFLGLIIGLAIVSFFEHFRWIYVLAGAYFLLIYLYKFPRFLYSFKYKTTIYFFTGAFVFALIAMYVIRTEEHKKDFFDKQIFGQKYLAENDLLGEGLLTRVIQTIEQDTAIRQAITRQTLAREQTQQLVKSNHLDLYFDRYDTEVLAFDKNGNSLDISEGSQNLAFYEKNYKQETYKTSNPSVFFINDVGNNFIKQYLTFIPIQENSSLIGYIVLDLKLRDEFAQSVYPELLLDKKFTQTPDTKNYSYAIFDKKNYLIFSSGSYNYIRKLPLSILSDSTLYLSGIQLNDYNHVGKIGQNGRKIVISAKYLAWKNLFSNFSFLFLLSVLFIIFVMILYAIRYGFKNLNVNFATKIQLYLNAAFLLPLLLVIIITLSVIDSTFISNQEKGYLDNTKNITSTVQLQLEGFIEKRMSRAFLEQEINDLARDTKLDINFYGLDGKLNLTTRPLVYEYGLLSTFINPSAYRRIIEEKENEVLLPESLGNLHYKTAYMSIKGHDSKPIGVIGIPFFDAKPTLDRQVTDVVASILSVFAWLFLILLILSYFASNILTNPLRLVAQKLKKTNLDKLNDRLEWNSDDEIGILMREYNKMLKKLEESKVALSMSEKQTAWREMAKQVAHEIKNPLTPMKLSIQQLQRTIVVDNPKTKERIGRALNSLTEQIDNISEIANSFSEFAKMPVPRNEVFDLVPLIQKSADLYAEDERISLNAYIKEREAWVVGDRQFMSRVITNLIINGIQSVPKEKRAIINLRLYRNEDDNIAIIEIQDNGSGIPENIRQRVFIPNFTTKVGGSGLGLAMARRGVEHAGGNIWFETETDRGTTFFIDLPLAIRQ